MAEKAASSTNNLVEPVDGVKGKKLPQYIAALSVCMGSVAAGAVLGYTGNITKEEMQAGDLNDISIDESEYSWLSSLMTLGALIMCFPIGFICDLLGRKLAMLLTIIPFSVGWLLIIFANNVEMVYAGRFLTGLAGGAFCVSAPLYTSEIAEDDIRGTLGSFFQLLLTVGILLAYILGAFVNAQIVAIVCAIIPLVFGVLFFLQPETPIYLMKKNKEDEAEASLRRLRGDSYDVKSELKRIKTRLDEDAADMRTSFLESFKKRATKKSLLICFGLMFFQQLSGINAVIFYVGNIFRDAGSSLSAEDATILVGCMQVAATFVSSLIVDRFGRKILLLISDIMMAVSGILLAVYFTLKNSMSEQEIQEIGSLPIVALSLFIIVFSLGFGPIPWMISSEVFPPEIKSNASSAAGTFNWFLAFIVTRFYGDLSTAIGTDTTFYIFAGISIVGTVFIFFVVPETKGKSMEQIQAELSGEKYSPKSGHDNQAYS